MKKVVEKKEVFLEEVDGSKGYVMKGSKGDFILARDTHGDYIWVRLTPGKVTKPVNTYNDPQEAIKDKLDEGYEVYEFTKAELL